ncbi:MAG: ribulose-phosphate 3-epimerase [Lachnospiraceae bacterium]|nr:ribulose-phosphate 3-epimerase [Lachnospiraceae bacterium]
MKNILAPSILSADFAKLGEQMKITQDAGATWAHIDVMDGMFVPSLTIGMPVVKSLRKASDLFFDVHLMINEPKRYVEEFCDAGSDMVTFHLEAEEDIDGTIDLIKNKGVQVGITIKPKTDTEAIRPYLDRVDMVLIMTVEPGFGGQSYIDACTEKIVAARKMIDATGRDIRLEVDGGIKLDNVHVVLDAGADTIVAGSAIYGGDIAANTRAFLERL